MHAERLGDITGVETMPRIVQDDLPGEAGEVPPVLRLAQEIVRRHVEGLLAETGAFDLTPSRSPVFPPDVPRLILRPGAGVLLNAQNLSQLAELLRRHPGAEILLPLQDAASLGQEIVPRNAGTCFAVMDGADLLAAALHAGCPPDLRGFVESLRPKMDNMLAAMRAFTDRGAEVAVIGPIQPLTWRFLEDEVACRVRVYGDGHGRHAGIAAELYRRVGIQSWEKWLRGMADVILIDTRQFLAGQHPYPSPQDFLASDLGRPAEVAHPLLRELTEAAGDGALPLVLGGSMLLNGGLYALVETAWRIGPDVDREYHIRWQ